MQQWELCSQWTNVRDGYWAAVGALMNWLGGDHVVNPTEASHHNRGSCVFCVVCVTQQYGAVLSVRGPCRRFITDTENRLQQLDSEIPREQ
jgi:hypothetical protein